MIRRIVWVLAGVACGLGSAAIYNIVAPQIYEAESLILIRPPGAAGIGANDAVAGRRLILDDYRSQYELIRSLAVAKAVAKKVGVKGQPSEFQGLKSPAAAIRKRIRVEPVGGSYSLVRVTFRGKHPAEARRLNAAVVLAYRLQLEQRESKRPGVAIRWLTEDLPRLRGKLNQAESDLVAYQKETGIIALDDRLKHQQAELAKLRSELTKTTLHRIKLEARRDRVRSVKPEAYRYIPFLVENKTVDNLLAQRLALKLQSIERARRFGPKHESVVSLEGKGRVLEQALEEELARLAESVKESYAVTRTQQEKLREELDARLAAAKDFNRQAAHLQALQREADAWRQLYGAMLKRLEGASLASSTTLTRVHVIDPPERPTEPVEPQIARNLLRGGMGGLLLGIVLSFLTARVRTWGRSAGESTP